MFRMGDYPIYFLSMDIIDTHCHLDMAAFDHDRAQIIARCHARHVTRIVVPAVMASGWEHLLAVCEQHAGLYPALGLHPVFLDHHAPSDLAALERKLAEASPVAVGEIGLDHYRPELDRQQQLTLFEAQLVLAREAHLPVLLHVRKAHDQVIRALKQQRPRGGISHAFNGSLQQARQYIELGFKLGFGGTLTYANAKHIQQLARELPLESLVLETDAPDMVVAGHRGERNSPEYLPQILAALAAVREEPVDRIAAQTTRNALEVLNLHGPES